MNRYNNFPPCMRDVYDPMATTGQMPYDTSGGMPMYPLPVISPTGYPTGMPVGAMMNPPPVPQFPVTGTTPQTQLPASQPSIVGPSPTTINSTDYTAGFLKTQIGKKMRVDFLVGTSSLTDRSGILVGVGASYILLQEETGEITMCDLYSIKFASILPQMTPMTTMATT